MCRGVAYHAATAATPECERRILLTTALGQLVAIDADTGRPCRTFATNGSADLHIGMGDMQPDAALPTAPPTVVNGTVVVGQSISDFRSFDSQWGSSVATWRR